ncbi:hypothetical protein B566_EDAN015553 [Ephemera danica]|nr:hypothetical protein B566_EDAN015553 [Ephemera danica]
MKMKQIDANFLWKAAMSIPVNSTASGVIASQILTNLKIESDNSIGSNFTTSVFKDTASCMHCMNPWRFHDYKVALKPAKRLPKSLKKIQRRNAKNPNCLRKHEKKFLGRLATSNTMVLTCPVCSKSTNFPIPAKKVVEVPPPLSAKEQKSLKKKKKKKDRLCGLKMALIDPKPRKPGTATQGNTESTPVPPVPEQTEPQTSGPTISPILANSNTPVLLKYPKVLTKLNPHSKPKFKNKKNKKHN